jgi:hypothetical protein
MHIWINYAGLLALFYAKNKKQKQSISYQPETRNFFILHNLDIILKEWLCLYFEGSVPEMPLTYTFILSAIIPNIFLGTMQCPIFLRDFNLVSHWKKNNQHPIWPLCKIRHHTNLILRIINRNIFNINTISPSKWDDSVLVLKVRISDPEFVANIAANLIQDLFHDN